MHIVFFADPDGAVPVGNGTADAKSATDNAGYIPDKVGSSGGKDVYRIQVPAGANYFQINNGVGKGTGTANYSLRQSEIKPLTVNALYKFVDSGSTAEDYIRSGETPTTVESRQNPRYRLDIENKIPEGDIELPESETVDIHIATVVIGSDGNIASIKWLKDDLNHIDSNYLANTNGSGTVIKLKKQGDYYWKETVPPSGYTVNPNPAEFSIPGYDANNPPEISDDPIPKTGTLSLKKKLATAKTSGSNSGEGQSFTFTVTLTAPIGFAWGSYRPALTGAATTMTNVSSVGQTLTFDVTLPATNTAVTISNIPDGTYYSVTEQAKTGFESAPVKIEKGAAEVSEIAGNDSGADYTVTNKRKTGSLTVSKEATGALSEAGVNDQTVFTDTITLTAPTGVDLRDYISWTALTASTYNATVKKINGTAVSGNGQSEFNSAAIVLGPATLTLY